MSAKQLSTKPKSIASRERSAQWEQWQKDLYKRQSADRVALSKRKIKLMETTLWQDADDETKRNMESNLREEVANERRRKGIHGNAIR